MFCSILGTRLIVAGEVLIVPKSFRKSNQQAKLRFQWRSAIHLSRSRNVRFNYAMSVGVRHFNVVHSDPQLDGIVEPEKISTLVY